MKQNILYFLIIVVVLKACQTETWYRTESGLVYKVIPSNSKDSVARLGRTIKVQVIQKAGDTIIQNTYNEMPYYEMIMPYGNSYNPSATFPGLKKGDSVIVKQLVDSMLKKRIFEKLPPYLKRSDEWITTIKVLDVFTNDSLLQVDKQKEAEKYVNKLKAGADKKIDDYLKSNKIEPQKTTDGIYVLSNTDTLQIVQGKWINIQFKLQTLSGKVLNDTKTDTTQKGPIGFVIGSGFFPPIIENTLMNKGRGEIKIYLPAVLLFGLNTPKETKKDDALLFDIQILDIKHKVPTVNKKK